MEDILKVFYEKIQDMQPVIYVSYDYFNEADSFSIYNHSVFHLLVGILRRNMW